MDSKEMDEKFDAIYMAISLGYKSAAQSAFKISIQKVIDLKLDQVIDFLEREDISCLIRDIERFKSHRMTKS